VITAKIGQRRTFTPDALMHIGQPEFIAGLGIWGRADFEGSKVYRSCLSVGAWRDFHPT
jgi:hypothetical protein